MSNSNDKRMIAHMIDRLDSKVVVTAVEKSRKHKSLQITKNKLDSHLKMLYKSMRTVERDIAAAELQNEIVLDGLKSYDGDDTPVVTEHALLRYVERVMNIDLNDVHAKILKLPKNHVVRQGNTIVTVYTTPDDHFNLAERESE